jgi:glucosamine--fructose-6-phosphate aminotransferase (isomerizing)
MNKFLKEILEQPLVVENLPGFYYNPEGGDLLKRVKGILNNNRIAQIIFTGMGSSYFVSGAASTLFNELNLLSFAINTSELLHYNLKLFERETFLVCISQSGESFEIKEILKNIPSKVHCVGIVNEEQSTLARKAEVALPCHGGMEEMTSTKTYILTTLV